MKDIKVGDVVEIIDCIHDHGFNIGEKVTIIKVDEGCDCWLAEDKYGTYWWIVEKEFKEVV